MLVFETIAKTADMNEKDPSDPRSQFERGFAAGRDPVQAAFALGGSGRTTVRSPWLQRLCERCGHSFRIGDSVQRSPDGKIAHRENTAVCAIDPSQSCTTSVQRRDFYEGLRQAWPPPPGLPVKRLEPSDPLLAYTAGGLPRRACAICGHTLRPFEEVVICPCSPLQPLCRAAVHRDPTRRLYCWDDWRGSQFCPVTARRLT